METFKFFEEVYQVSLVKMSGCDSAFISAGLEHRFWADMERLYRKWDLLYLSRKQVNYSRMLDLERIPLSKLVRIFEAFPCSCASDLPNKWRYLLARIVDTGEVPQEWLVSLVEVTGYDSIFLEESNFIYVGNPAFRQMIIENWETYKDFSSQMMNKLFELGIQDEPFEVLCLKEQNQMKKQGRIWAAIAVVLLLCVVIFGLAMFFRWVVISLI